MPASVRSGLQRWTAGPRRLHGAAIVRFRVHVIGHAPDAYIPAREEARLGRPLGSVLALARSRPPADCFLPNEPSVGTRPAPSLSRGTGRHTFRAKLGALCQPAELR